jgi:hypothetical protein
MFGTPERVLAGDRQGGDAGRGLDLWGPVGLCADLGAAHKRVVAIAANFIQNKSAQVQLERVLFRYAETELLA